MMSMPLSTDDCVEVLARLERVEDKLAFASTCHSALEASRDPRAWIICSVAEVDKERRECATAPSATRPWSQNL